MKIYFLKTRYLKNYIFEEISRLCTSMSILNSPQDLNIHKVYDADCIIAPLMYNNYCIFHKLKEIKNYYPHIPIIILFNKNEYNFAEFCLNKECSFILLDISRSKEILAILTNSSLYKEFLVKLNYENKLKTPRSKIIQKALHFIFYNFKEITSNDVYLFVNPPVSERVFTREFKKACGTTPNKLIRSLRMEYAAFLGEKTNYTLKQISIICGFYNYKRFSELFKAYHKTTFTDYMNQFKESE